jgi:predicted DNA-binding transcriptional regulator YafY
MRSATLTKEHFEPRDGFEPTKLRNARTAQILYAKDVARFAAERGARRLTDGTALAERPYGDDEWLESEILAGRGGAVLVEPAELRTRIATRAKALAKELGVERLRAPA